MRLERLRRVLRTSMEISVETSQDIANQVIAAAARRRPSLPLGQTPKVPQPFKSTPESG